jgi:hypothetical protein
MWDGRMADIHFSHKRVCHVNISSVYDRRINYEIIIMLIDLVC